jgi:hypothetical protein
MSRVHRPLSRRALFAATLAGAVTIRLTANSRAQTGQQSIVGIFAATGNLTLSLALFDAETGTEIHRFDVGPRPNAAWSTPMPGIALVRTETSFSIVDASSGSVRPIPVPETVAGTLTPNSIQFRGSAGKQRILIGTPNFDANTFVVDLTTGERQAVVGLLGAVKPPVSIQNAAISADDRYLLAWDGRTTWIVDLNTKISRVLGSGLFTFSAGFSEDGSLLVYSQQMADGSTQLLLQGVDGLNERMIGKSATGILVSLWIPSRNLLLLDERTSTGGKLAVFDQTADNRQDVLDYTGATNIVQISPNGRFALAGIEGGQGRDWYQIELSLGRPSSRLLDGLTDAVILPGFDFHAAWALALPPASTGTPTAVKSIDLTTGNIATLISGITGDAALSGEVVAPSGNAALLTIDSFTELAVHFLRLDAPKDIPVDLMKGGSGVIAPDGSSFAVAHELNTSGAATVVYDQSGAEGVTFPGQALAWI